MLNWMEIAGPDLIRSIERELEHNAPFRESASKDLNVALKTHLGIELPVVLAMTMVDGQCTVAPSSDYWEELTKEFGDELPDEMLDAVSGGSSLGPIRFLAVPPDAKF